MKKLLLAAALVLLPSAAFAQCNGVFPTGTVCGNATGTSNIPTATNYVAGSVMNFGAKGNTVKLSDGAITAPGTLFTSATAPFSAGDVGKVIRIAGAGAAGAALETTIASFVSATQVNVTVAATTSVTGAVAFFGTDDTAAFQAAANTQVARGGNNCIYIPQKTFIISSPIVFAQFSVPCIYGFGSSSVSDTGSEILQSVGQDAIRINSNDSATFSNFLISYISQANTNTAGIRFTPPGSTYNFGSRITNVTITNSYDGIVAAEVVQAVFQGNFFSNFVHTGITKTSVLNAGDSGDNRFISNYFFPVTGTPVACFYWTGGGGDTFIGNKCSLTQIGIYLNPAAGINTSQINIANNSLDGASAAGVRFVRQDATSQMNQLLLTGNTCNLFGATAATCLDLPLDGGGTGIKNVTAVGNTVFGPSVANTMFNLNTVTNVVISDNVLQSNNASTNGIVVGSTVANALVGANTFTGTFSIDWSNASASYKVANAITPSTNSIVVSTADRLATSASCTIVNGSLNCTSANSFAPQPTTTNTAADANSALLIIAKNRSGGNTNSGDTLGDLVFQGFANTAARSSAIVTAVQTATSSGSNIPTKLSFLTSNAAGLQNQAFTFDQNSHLAITTQATAATISAGCNGTGASITGGGGVASDVHGTVIGQNAAATTCTISFGTAFTNAPDCVFQGFQSPITVVNSVGTASFQVTFASTANYKFSYHCNGV